MVLVLVLMLPLLVLILMLPLLALPMVLLPLHLPQSPQLRPPPLPQPAAVPQGGRPPSPADPLC